MRKRINWIDIGLLMVLVLIILLVVIGALGLGKPAHAAPAVGPPEPNTEVESVVIVVPGWAALGYGLLIFGGTALFLKTINSQSPGG